MAAERDPIDDLLANKTLTSPDLDLKDLIQPAWDSLAKFRGKTYGFLNWNYNVVYWARGDLLGHADEKAAFKKRYGYDLGPAKTLQQMRDIAEFFTRKKGEKLAGQPLDSDFYGVVLEGIKGGTTFWTVWTAFIRNFGGDVLDAEGRPTVDRPENVAAVKLGGAIEITAGAVSRDGPAKTKAVEVIKALGTRNVFVASDSGLVGTPNHPDAMAMAAKATPTNQDGKDSRNNAGTAKFAP